MKILLQSTLFHPSVGGIETVSKCLAENYVRLGNECTVITRTAALEPDREIYNICRNPGKDEKKELVQNHDIIHCNGASLELVFLAKKYSKPIIWTHAGYQLVCIDGLGWYEGNPSPLRPLQSYLFHCKQQGFARASIEIAKLALRILASHLVTKNVAITKWVAMRQPLPNQTVIYNPFPLSQFSCRMGEAEEYEFDFFFLGRLVSEKGVGTLLKAFHLFLQENPTYNKKLLIIGNGNWLSKLIQICHELSITEKVVFAGKQTGSELLKWVKKGKISIIPSEWEEPMGGVALEMLAAGKLVIVSENGGLSECIGNAGITFPNGNFVALKEKMNLVLHSAELQTELFNAAPAQLANFQEMNKVLEYITLFSNILNE
ncbi:MAG: glycosyltransferase family 4 protein [Opitutaceae bacterium]|nr:glycosyltransferase family 4 protein [Cytophagales bacterium]